MKICFITEDFYPDFIGGQGIYGKNLIENLVKKIKVTVIAENREKRKKFWQNKKNIKLILVPFCFGNQLVLAFLEYLYFIIYERRDYFEIVHVNQLSGLFFILFRPKNVGKIVVSCHNTNYDMWQVENFWLKKLLYLPLIFLEKIIYKKADGIIFNSHLEQKDLLNYFQIKDKSTKAVYLGGPKVNFTEVEKQQAYKKVRKELGLKPETKIVLYLGRIVKRKKVGTLIKAANNLYKNYKDHKIYIIVIGRGSELKRLKKTASVNVKFLGFVEDIKDYYLAADLFVLTSVAEGGFSLSVLEAASYGLPLIISPLVAGFPIIKDGKNGYIVDPNDSDQLSEKILSTLKHQKKFSQESLKISKKFTWEKCAKATAVFYRSLLEKH